MKVRNGFVSNSSSTAFAIPLKIFYLPNSYEQIIELAKEFKDEDIRIVGENILLPFLGDVDYFKEKICKILSIAVDSDLASNIVLTNIEY